ncbi:MAG: RHS repeat protein, partial [Deltaproteobacteria bacterium]|nr:RHS repeat protein [Deltaproteobacteria bacterium]
LDGTRVEVTTQHGGRSVLSSSMTRSSMVALVETTVRDATTGQLTSSTDARGVSEAWDWDPSTGLLAAHHEGGRGMVVHRYAYDCRWGALGAPCTISTPSAPTTSHEYDALGRAVRTTWGPEATETALRIDGAVLESRQLIGDGAWHRRSYTYDAHGRVRTETEHDLETHAARTTLATTYSYDEVGRVETRTAPSGAVTRYAYDALDRPTLLTRDAETLRIGWDASGNRTSLEHGSTHARWRYDGHDRVQTAVSPDGRTTSYEYDATGLRRTTISTRTTTISTLSIDARDELGRPTSWTQGGLVTRQLYAPGRATTLGPHGERSSSEWDARGFVHAVDSSDGTRWTRRADAAGRLSSLRGQASTSTHTTTLSFGYGSGRLTELRDGTDRRLVSLERRPDGAVSATRIDPDGASLRTETRRSGLGEPVGRVTALGVRTSWTLDEERRPSAEGPPMGLRRHAYDASGRMESTTYPDGSAARVTSRDADGLPTRISLPGAGSVDVSWSASRRVRSRRIISGGYVDSEAYDYDDFGRLAASTSNGLSTTHRYDPDDFWMETTVSSHTYRAGRERGSRTTYSVYPSGPRVESERTRAGLLASLSVAGSPLIASATHDASGRFATVSLQGGLTRTDLFDARERLVERRWSQSGEPVLTLGYTYDGAGREVGRRYVERGEADLFFYDEDSRLSHAELRATSSGPAGPWSPRVPPEVTGTWSAGAYARSYAY